MITADLETARDLAGETLYRFLGATFSDPRYVDWYEVLADDNQRVVAQAADLLREEFASESIPLGFGELPIEELNARPLLSLLTDRRAELPAEYVRVFGLIPCRECPLYETEYHSVEDTFFRSQQMADVAGFYRAFGLEPSHAARERPDHLALELEFSAFLLTKKRLAEVDDPGGRRDTAEICQAARVSFFRDHLSWWTPSFTMALRKKSAGTKELGATYEAVGSLLAALLPVERFRLQVPAPRMPLTPNPMESPDECSGCLVDLKTA